MTQQRVYLAGRMSGHVDFNFVLFDHVAKRLRYAGYDVFSPAEHARQVLGSLDKIQAMHPKALQAARRRLLAYELNWICLNAEIVFLLPDWKDSLGAKAEYAAAIACGIEIREVPNILLPERGDHGSDHQDSTDQGQDTGPHVFTS